MNTTIEKVYKEELEYHLHRIDLYTRLIISCIDDTLEELDKMKEKSKYIILEKDIDIDKYKECLKVGKESFNLWMQVLKDQYGESR